MKLCIDKRGTMKNQIYLTKDRVELTFEMPLSEIVFDFYDKPRAYQRDTLRSITIMPGTSEADLVRLDILLNGEMVDAFNFDLPRPCL